MCEFKFRIIKLITNGNNSIINNILIEYNKQRFDQSYRYYWHT